MKTIKSSSEISHLFECGRRIGTRDVNFIVARNSEQHDREGRVAFIAGKKQGNAVWRNKAKRRMRGLCRDLGGPFEGYDMLFVARKGLNDASYEQLLDQSERALSKKGISSH